MQDEARVATDVDVAIVGGAFSGAATAVMLRRALPESRILVVERRRQFDRKVGEATVEASGLFLTRALGLFDHLSREHLPKHGLRWWFTDGSGRRLDEMSEIGPSRVSALPSFQLDRAKLDEHLLSVAESEGVEVLRPAKVGAVELGWPQSRLTVGTPDGERSVSARWVVDASGRQCFVGRRLGLVERVERHPTAAAWGRWRGVADLDGVSVMGSAFPGGTLPPVAASRRLATNHFCGYGWWIWVIPLADGDTSIGVVYDSRLFDWPHDGGYRERYVDFVTERVDGLRDLLRDAEPIEGDFFSYDSLPYRLSRVVDRGWAAVGDAAGFLDPIYSPGLDYCSASVFATSRLIAGDLGGCLDEAALDRAIETHDGNFVRAYDRWLDALYTDKYELLGDAELTTASFLVDTGTYYLGVVGPLWRDMANFANPPFGLDNVGARGAARLLRAFKRRLVTIARLRRRFGTYGRRNLGWRLYPSRFQIDPGPASALVLRGLRLWLRAELGALWIRLTQRADRLDPEPFRNVQSER